jgi:hypothetical protein
VTYDLPESHDPISAAGAVTEIFRGRVKEGARDLRYIAASKGVDARRYPSYRFSPNVSDRIGSFTTETGGTNKHGDADTPTL